MNILVSFHTPVNAGYAMAKLERTFYDVMVEICGSAENVFFSFTKYNGEHPISLPIEFSNVFELNPLKLNEQKYFGEILNLIKVKNINLALCFDLQVSGLLIDVLRKGNVEKVISYWGSTISSLNSGIKLLFKKIEVLLKQGKPDLFIFESESMRRYATHGRGISINRTKVIPTGVDTEELKPNVNYKNYVHEIFTIPDERKVAIYSGHMEERKGVHVIIDAFKYLIENILDNDWHLVVCGNRPGEEQVFLGMMKDHKALKHVTFAGYRDDLPKILPSCDLGVIASTGWDSFPMSALEMASCGLPVLASALQGLVETIEDKKTGLLFPPGDYKELARLLNELGKSDNGKLVEMSIAARKRILDNLSLNIQKNRLIKTINNLTK